MTQEVLTAGLALVLEASVVQAFADMAGVQAVADTAGVQAVADTAGVQAFADTAGDTGGVAGMGKDQDVACTPLVEGQGVGQACGCL